MNYIHLVMFPFTEDYLYVNYISPNFNNENVLKLVLKNVPQLIFNAKKILHSMKF